MFARYANVCLESFGYALPEEVVTTVEIENRLRPLYERLRLPPGRLELMTGIRERRFWPRGMLPSEASIRSGELALEIAEVDRRRIGALIHASVCRDHLEPATANRVHWQLGLSREAAVFDISNACLGLLNGALQIANMIELGQIEAGLVVGTESGRALVENTIDVLNRDQTLTREDIKQAVASLTIGSGSAAMLLVDRRLSRTGNRLVAAVAANDTSQCALCHSGSDEAADAAMRPWMQTDSEKLLHAGVATASQAFPEFLEATGWDTPQKTFCHQVGQAHQRLLFQSLGLNPAHDFSTFEWLGNTGAVAVPMTAAIGIEQGHLEPGDQLGLFGIGSGINTIMLGIDWQTNRGALKAGQRCAAALP